MDLYPEDFTTVTIFFSTNDAAGAAVAPSSAFEAADIVIYKNGSATQKTSTNGVTMTSPFDSITGLHCVVIDTSNDTGDSGFWVAGAVYDVVLYPDETVDGQAVVKHIGKFYLGPPQVDVRQFGGTAGTFSGGRPEVKLGDVAHGGSSASANFGAGVRMTSTTAQGLYIESTADGYAGCAMYGSGGGSGAFGLDIEGGAASSAGLLITGFTRAIYAPGNSLFDSLTVTTNAIAWNAAWDTEVQSECADALGAAGAITATSFAAGAITAAAIADGAIDAATFAAGAITASAIAADAIGASELAADAAQEIADAVLSRNVSNVEGSMPEHCIGTTILSTLESSVSGSTWTIKRTDGSTTHATKTVTSDSSAAPITGVS